MKNSELNDEIRISIENAFKACIPIFQETICNLIEKYNDKQTTTIIKLRQSLTKAAQQIERVANASTQILCNDESLLFEDDDTLKPKDTRHTNDNGAKQNSHQWKEKESRDLILSTTATSNKARKSSRNNNELKTSLDDGDSNHSSLCQPPLRDSNSQEIDEKCEKKKRNSPSHKETLNSAQSSVLNESPTSCGSKASRKRKADDDCEGTSNKSTKMSHSFNFKDSIEKISCGEEANDFTNRVKAADNLSSCPPSFGTSDPKIECKKEESGVIVTRISTDSDVSFEEVQSKTEQSNYMKLWNKIKLKETPKINKSKSPQGLKVYCLKRSLHGEVLLHKDKMCYLPTGHKIKNIKEHNGSPSPNASKENFYKSAFSSATSLDEMNRTGLEKSSDDKNKRKSLGVQQLKAKRSVWHSRKDQVQNRLAVGLSQTESENESNNDGASSPKQQSRDCEQHIEKLSIDETKEAEADCRLHEIRAKGEDALERQKIDVAKLSNRNVRELVDRQRRAMATGTDCSQCSEFYKCLGDGCQTTCPSNKQQVSKHRFHGIPNSTPPRYWDIGFPSQND